MAQAKKIKKLYRNRQDKIIAGVCSGFADYLEQDPTIIRVIAILLTIFTGVIPGIIAYIILALIIPAKN